MASQIEEADFELEISQSDLSISITQLEKQLVLELFQRKKEVFGRAP